MINKELSATFFSFDLENLDELLVCLQPVWTSDFIVATSQCSQISVISLSEWVQFNATDKNDGQS